MYCLQVVHANEIAELKAQISSLSSQVAQLLAPKQLPDPQVNSKAAGSTETPDLTSTGPSAQQPISKVNAAPTVHDRKYNIVLYGMRECSKGTNRSVRTKQDLEKVTKTLAGIDKDIGSQNVRDCFRLGEI